jgi:putative peptidoglycan lipid II flippase
MVFNVMFLAILFILWVPANLQHGPVLVALAKVPGLHFALGLASALASYLNLSLLWHWLKKAGVYDRQPGWGRFLFRLLAACTAMAAALGLGLHWAPDFTVVPTMQRIAWLALLVVGGIVVYLAAMLAVGFRPRDLREH